MSDFMQKCKWLCIILMSCHLASAQNSKSLTLTECVEMAKKNYPVVKQFALIEKSNGYLVANAKKDICRSLIFQVRQPISLM